MDESTPHQAVTFTDANFKEEVLDFDGVVMVDFWAEWCPPCKVMGPAVEALAADNASNLKVKVGKVDVDSNQKTSSDYSVLSIPAFKIFHNGKVIDELVGSMAPEELKAVLDRAIATL